MFTKVRLASLVQGWFVGRVYIMWGVPLCGVSLSQVQGGGISQVVFLHLNDEIMLLSNSSHIFISITSCHGTVE